jgi:hypothetical protein
VYLQTLFQLFDACIFSFKKGKFILKMQLIADSFYLGYKKQPWFGPAGFENACNVHRRKQVVATQL